MEDGRTMVPLTPRETPTGFKRRASRFLGIALLGFFVLLGRVWHLQVLRGHELRVLSDSNRIRLHRVQATRGTVKDRHGRVLVDSRPSFDAVLVPEDAPDLEAAVENISQYLRQGSAETQALLQQAKGRPPFQQVVVKRDLSWDEVSAVETHQLDLPGVSLQITPRRSYPHSPALAHILGYVGEVSPADLERDSHYRMGDLIGKAGLERGWERYLRGMDGGQQVEVDAVGRRLRVLREVEEVPGSTVTLTVDLDLQQAAEAAFAGKDGALVALDPRNGEVLAFVSRPAPDPNMFARGVRVDEWRAITGDPKKPLNNRAIQGQYPPGSTFKIVVAAAALEEGVINPFTRINCSGGMQYGNRFFRCWKAEGHGSVDLHEALVQSCDVYFYQVGQRLGIDSIAEWARRFGLGMPTGIALANEKAGIVPDSEWKRKRFHEPWYSGETLSAAIGQGYVTVTPLQMAQLIGMVATGKRHLPRFVSRIEAPEGELMEEYGPELAATLSMKKSTINTVRAALRDVVATDRGTGKRARVQGVDVAGKTGTSQVVKMGRKRVKSTRLPWKQRDHAWFVAYAPVEEPQIAVATVVEHAEGGGGAVAAPTTQAVLGAFFRLKKEREGNQYADVRPAPRFSF